MKVYINGRFYSKENSKISVFDHGLLYGDGVFEGIRSYNRLVFKLREHIERLFESAHTIMLDIPMSAQQMVSAVVLALKENKLKDAYIRVQAISHMEKFEKKMDAVQYLEAAMEEAFDQDEEILWPRPEEVHSVVRDH